MGPGSGQGRLHRAGEISPNPDGHLDRTGEIPRVQRDFSDPPDLRRRPGEIGTSCAWKWLQGSPFSRGISRAARDDPHGRPNPAEPRGFSGGRGGGRGRRRAASAPCSLRPLLPPSPAMQTRPESC